MSSARHRLITLYFFCCSYRQSQNSFKIYQACGPGVSSGVIIFLARARVQLPGYISSIFYSMFMKFRFREHRGRVGNCLSSFYWAQTLLPPTEQLSWSVCARGSPCICIWNAPCGMGLVHDKAVNWLFSCARDLQKAVSFRHTRPARRNTSRALARTIKPICKWILSRAMRWKLFIIDSRFAKKFLQ